MGETNERETLSDDQRSPRDFVRAGVCVHPTQMAPIYGVPIEPHTTLEVQFFGSALIGLGVVFWFARDFRDWDAVKGVLIATVVGSVVGGGVNLLGTFQGLLNGMAWSTTVIYALLFIGSLYCLSAGPETSGVAARPAR
jgi:asparagine N-glycosylation enzyme membrane subunit Stt3